MKSKWTCRKGQTTKQRTGAHIGSGGTPLKRETRAHDTRQTSTDTNRQDCTRTRELKRPAHNKVETTANRAWVLRFYGCMIIWGHQAMRLICNYTRHCTTDNRHTAGGLNPSQNSKPQHSVGKLANTTQHAHAGTSISNKLCMRAGVLRRCLVLGVVIQAAPHKEALHQDEEW